MRIEQLCWSNVGGWGDRSRVCADAGLVLVFGGRDQLATQPWLIALRERHPNAIVFGCSTAGEIAGTAVLDDAIVATAVSFTSTRCALAVVEFGVHASPAAAAAALVGQLPREGLVHLLVLCDGDSVNGTELTSGLRDNLSATVAVTGGLAADGARFGNTLVVADAAPRPQRVAALGLYGPELRVGYGCLGGWDPFGPERLITRSRGNVLYELDGTGALELYRRYLGGHADELPAAALRFPLMLRGKHGERGLVRTILGIDEAEGAMRFAGEMPEGCHASLMKANFERLIDGAHGAAEQCVVRMGDPGAELALLISCVGRKLVLRRRVDEELEAVREVVGASTVLAGFYSYGEICPVAPQAGCELHNQTMTITTLREG